MICVQHTNIYRIHDYSNHLKKLEDGDKISRFGYLANNHAIDQLILNMCYHPSDHELWYAETNDNRIGWGHMAKNNDNSWELAVSVDHEFQRQGVGNLLITEMLDWAKFHHVPEVYMFCIEDNKVIQHLAEKHKLKTREKSGNERIAALKVPVPTFVETNVQLWKEHNEIMTEFAKLRKRYKEIWSNAVSSKIL